MRAADDLEDLRNIEAVQSPLTSSVFTTSTTVVLVTKRAELIRRGIEVRGRLRRGRFHFSPRPAPLGRVSGTEVPRGGRCVATFTIIEGFANALLTRMFQ